MRRACPATIRPMEIMGIRIPTIVVTGSRDLGEIAKVLGIEIFAFVPKPVSVDYLEHLVGLALPKAPPALAS